MLHGLLLFTVLIHAMADDDNKRLRKSIATDLAGGSRTDTLRSLLAMTTRKKLHAIVKALQENPEFDAPVSSYDMETAADSMFNTVRRVEAIPLEDCGLTCAV